MAGEKGKRGKKRRRKRGPDNPVQPKSFIEVAKELGLDVDETDFERAMDSLARKLATDQTGEARRKAIDALKRMHPGKPRKGGSS
ncbi:MAG TPA: hypothetical protein VFB93_05625 [Burkholderiales bacterium]|nr:hypothetical protein [Burkholderiales bacterium]